MTMWMVRAGSDGSLFEPFIRNNLIAIGWPALGDLGHIESREELITRRISRATPGANTDYV